MSALAKIMAHRGYSVSGSDKRKASELAHLTDEGIKIFLQQSSSNINEITQFVEIPPLVVISTAIPKNNPELKAAIQEKLEIWHRSDLLAALIDGQASIAVAGSHGKTTTSTIITTLLAESGQDPTAIIGGSVPFYQSNGHAGQGRLLVAEADESDGTLVKFQPSLGVITNLELDHIDHYCNLDALIQTMRDFSRKCNRVLANYDCENLRNNFKASSWWSVKESEGLDFAGLPIQFDGKQTIANFFEKGKFIDQIILPIPGIHNLSNTIAAIAACRLEGIPFNQLKKGIALLTPPKRRFEFRGLWNERLIVDDYAHHPSEIQATLAMARLMVNTKQTPLPLTPKRLLVIFQPHRYSRTNEFLNEFAKELGVADVILLAPIYSAGECPLEGVSNHSLAKCIQKIYPKHQVFTADNLEQLSLLVQKNSRKNDLILTMGAGDINRIWDKLAIQSHKNQWLPNNLAA